MLRGDQAFKEAGLGYGTFLILLITGMIWCADAAEISLIMYVIKDVQKALRLSDASVVLLEQASFAGQLLGPMFWGRFADTRGRRPAILLCSGFVLGFGIITACAQTFWQLVIARAGVGFGISGMFICVDIACELLPKERALSIALNFFHPFGSMFTMFCAFLFLENSGWRMLTSCAVLPTFFALGLALAYLPESPRWLLENGRHFEALQSIRHIADLNGVKTSFTGLLPELPESELIPDASPKDAWFVWGQHRWTLLNQMCVWFSLGMNYPGIVLLGATLLVKTVVVDVDVTKQEMDFVSLSIAAWGEFFSVFATLLLIDRMGRRYYQALFYGTAGAAASLLIFREVLPYPLVAVAVIIVRCGVFAAGSGTWLHTPEIFPVQIRATAHAACNLTANIGRVLAPIVVSPYLSAAACGSMMASSLFIAVLLAVAAPESVQFTTKRRAGCTTVFDPGPYKALRSRADCARSES